MNKKIAVIACMFLIMSIIVAAQTSIDGYTKNNRQRVYIKFDDPNVTLVSYRLNHESGVETLMNIFTGVSSPGTTLYYFEPAIDQSYLEGINTFYVLGKDMLGNEMANAETFVFKADYTSPLLVDTVPAQNALVEQNPSLISLRFNEEVVLHSVIMGENITDKFSSGDNITWTSSINFTSDGTKNIQIHAADLAGNYFQDGTYTFSVDVFPLDVYLINPRHGVANTSMIDLKAGTDENAECRWSPITGTNYWDMNLFDVTGETVHTLVDFNIISSLYISCKAMNGETVAKTFSLSVDTTPPVILYSYADPDLVIERAGDGSLNTQLVAVTDEPVICKFSDTENDFDLMTYYFNINDPSSIGTYFRMNFANMSNLQGGNTYRRNVVCENLAGLKSLMSIIDFIVDTTVANDLTIISPSGFVTGKVNLSVTTLRNSLCLYSGNESKIDLQSGTFNKQGKVHEAEFSLLSGQHTYFVECIFSSGSPTTKQKSVSFIVDTTAPSTPIVNSSDPVLGASQSNLNKIYGTWKSTDLESGIAEYRVQVWEKFQFPPEQLVANKSVGTTESGYITGLTLEDGHQYELRVYAVNGVGLVSLAGTSAPVTIDVALAPGSCSDNSKNGDETDVDCGGLCSGCSNGKNCGGDSDCVSGNCDAGVCTGSVSDHCSDNQLNNDESDVDCGGSCSLCDNGEFCNSDLDCQSGNCKGSLCAEDDDQCYNYVQDQDETDMDCGGSCDGCPLGKACQLNSDCLSGNCQSGACVVGVTDSDGDGVADPSDNCPGTRPGCSVDSSGCIRNDFDGDGQCDELDTDDDNDGMPDSWELSVGLDPFYDDSLEDPDGDALTNIEEYNVRNAWSSSTNPNDPDTDGDGVSDSVELEKGTDPNDPNSRPENNLWLWLLIIIALAAGGAYYYYQFYYKKSHLVEERPPKFVGPEAQAPTSQLAQRQQMQRQTISGQPVQYVRPRKTYQRRPGSNDHARSVFDAFGQPSKPSSIASSKPRSATSSKPRSATSSKPSSIASSKPRSATSSKPSKPNAINLSGSKSSGQFEGLSKNDFQKTVNTASIEKKVDILKKASINIDKNPEAHNITQEDIFSEMRKLAKDDPKTFEKLTPTAKKRIHKGLKDKSKDVFSDLAKMSKKK